MRQASSIKLAGSRRQLSPDSGVQCHLLQISRFRASQPPSMVARNHVKYPIDLIGPRLAPSSVEHKMRQIEKNTMREYGATIFDRC